MSAKDMFTARRDAGDTATVLLTEMSRQNAAELVEAAAPPLILGVAADEPEAEFEVNLRGKLDAKRFRVSSLNAEKYKGAAALREELLEDLTETARAKNAAKRSKRNMRAARAGFSRPLRFALVTGACFLCAALLAFAALLGIAKLLELPQLGAYLPAGGAERFTACAWIALAAAALATTAYLACRLPRKKPTLRDRERRLQRALVSGRNAHVRHVVLVKNAGRLDGYTQLALYNALSSLIDYNPLTFAVILSDSSADNFRTYFRDVFPAPRTFAAEAPARAASPAVRAILGSGRSIPLPPRTEALAEQRKLPEPQEEPARIADAKPLAVAETEKPAAIEERSVKRLVERYERKDEPETPVPGQLDLLKDIPKADPPAFDFAGSTAKEVLHALSSGSLSGVPGFDVLYGALPKIARMPEKTLNEYLTVLDYTVRNLDLSETDFTRVEPRIWAKFVGWYRDMGQIARLMPLYRKAAEELNADVITLFLSDLPDADRAALRGTLSREVERCYQENAPFSALVPVYEKLSEACPEITDKLLTAVTGFASRPEQLAGKGAFAGSFAELLGTQADKFSEEALSEAYRFISALLATFEEPELIGAGMRLISAFKDKFRFQGLSIEALNDVIFNREFVNVEHKLDYIDSLLGSPQLTDAEKNRYVGYLVSTRDTLAPRYRLKVLQSLLKSGALVERENILEAVKWIRDDKSQDFLDELVRLLHAYAGVKGAKNDTVFADVCRQPLTVSERSRILRAYLSAGFQDTAKIAKALLKSCMTEDEALAALDYPEAVLNGLAPLSASSRLPRPEFTEAVCWLMERQESEEKFRSLLHLVALKYHRVTLNGDQKSDLKSAMFKGAQAFDGADLAVDTGVILKTFKIEYISFVEQKIAKQGDPEVEKRVSDALVALEQERE